MLGTASETVYFPGGMNVDGDAVTTGAWTSYSPSWTNLTVGNGTVTAAYARFGRIIHFRVDLLFGSTTAVSGSVRFSSPVNLAAAEVPGTQTMGGTVSMADATGGTQVGVLVPLDASTILVGVTQTDSTYLSINNTSSTIPFTWAVNDRLHITGSYEAAS